MHRTIRLVTLTLAAGLLAGCGEQRPITAPADGDGAPSLGMGAAGTRQVQMLDNCDPTSFDAVLGAGACTRPGGGMTFERFLDQLAKQQQVASWRFSPPQMKVQVGETIVAVNRGGEVHTFTEVAAFGGGFVPELNALSGNPVPAPECLAVQNLEFVPPGGHTTEHVHDAGVTRYMCCLHPWMRTTVEAR